MIGYIILGVIIFLLAVTAVRAAFFVPKKKESKSDVLPEEKIDVDRYCQNLSDAIKIKTISNYDREKVDWNEFTKFHKFLEERYPLIHKTLIKPGIPAFWRR